VAQTSETVLPAFDRGGDLPRGIYRIAMQQMLSRFGEGSRQRIAVAQRLERIYRVAIATGQVARFVVFGSFVTAKSEPADVDVFVLMDNTFDIGRLTGETRVLFDHAAAQAHFGACFGCVVLRP
jgi:predicted nucleotidyltransferase